MRAAALRYSVLADFIEQGFVADLQQGCGLLAIPVCFFQSAGYGFGFRFILGVARQRFQAAAAGLGVGHCGSARKFGVHSGTAIGLGLQFGCS